jgi:DNA (cytosine-5)-methyltransferase 1
VVENPEPFIVGNQAPVFVPRYGERPGQKPRALRVDQPSPVIVPTGNGASLVSAYLARHWGGMTAMSAEQPYPTITTKGSQDQPVTVELAQEPDGRSERVIAFLSKYYGCGTGQSLDEPAHTLTTKERLALVTVTVDGEPWVIVDIAMRMLTPRELYRCQGFKDDFIIDQGVPLDGDEQLGLSFWNEATSVPLTKTAQVRMVGNSVPPHLAEALALSNAPAAILRDRRTA